MNAFMKSAGALALTLAVFAVVGYFCYSSLQDNAVKSEQVTVAHHATQTEQIENVTVTGEKRPS